MDIIKNFHQQASSLHKTIVLPEGHEPRVQEAALFIAAHKLAHPILIGEPGALLSQNKALKDIEIQDPAASLHHDEWAHKFYELRKHKNMTPEKAGELLMNPLYFGAFLVREGLADGAVAGSINTTGDVLRAAIQVIGLAPQVSVVSSSFVMVMASGEIFTFADCAVIPDPDPEELASIAISSANTHRKLIGSEPSIAMLSFSTKGSAAHPRTEKVIEATRLVQSRMPSLKIDGELQFDAAYVTSVGQRKAPGSPVAGKANIYIFPDLDSGNISYKITQRLAGAEAIGPIIQGLAKPYNDLSRGCSATDIVNVACICAILS
jgi:phosphate acetyltransferase